MWVHVIISLFFACCWSHIKRSTVLCQFIGYDFEEKPSYSKHCNQSSTFPCTSIFWNEVNWLHNKVWFLLSAIFFWIVFREMFHGQRWRKNKLYQAPMMETPSMQLYVGDFVKFSHSSLGITFGKVQHLHEGKNCSTYINFLFNITMLQNILQTGEPPQCVHRGADATKHWAVLQSLPTSKGHHVLRSKLCCQTQSMWGDFFWCKCHSPSSKCDSAMGPTQWYLSSDQPTGTQRCISQ